MDSLHLAIAVIPLAVYLLALGFVNLSNRPLVISGARDLAALSVGVFGFVVAGPMELFLPEGAAAHFGWFIWPMMITLYVLSVSFLALTMRPRLVVYNMSFEQLRATLAQTAETLDPQARWAGSNLILPNMRVELHLEWFSTLRNVQLISTGAEQSYLGWRRLHQALANSLRQSAPARSAAHALAIAACGAIFALLGAAGLLRNPDAVVASFHEMMRF